MVFPSTNIFVYVLFLLQLLHKGFGKDLSEYPEGYYSFEQNPTKNPPRVKRPPYIQTNQVCPGVLETEKEASQSLQNLCGNLNEGSLPVNPIGKAIGGEQYPFDIIKNSTLEFFSKTLPILKEDKTLPKVAKYVHPKDMFRSDGKKRPPTFKPYKRDLGKSPNNFLKRIQRSTSSDFIANFDEMPQETFFDPRNFHGDGAQNQLLQEHLALTKAQEEGRSAKSFCENNYSIICLIYNTFTGRNKKSHTVLERKEFSFADGNSISTGGSLQPLTPCPSTVEYVTPVFARNYQGVWRYVVQIPYEGYFTQTVETTQCLSSQCHYLSGSCLASPRWVSLLVAETFYPDAIFPTASKATNLRRPVISSGSNPPPPLKRGQFAERQGHPIRKKETPKHCDGVDNIGCFQVRLYYDWFLVSGSCKCWKQDFYAQFAVKNQ